MPLPSVMTLASLLPLLPNAEANLSIGKIVWAEIEVVVPAPSAAMVNGLAVVLTRSLRPAEVEPKVWAGEMVRPRLSVWVTVSR